MGGNTSILLFRLRVLFSGREFCSSFHPITPTPIKVPRIVGRPVHVVGSLGTVALKVIFIHLLGKRVIVAQRIAVRSLAEVALQRAVVLLLGNGGGFHRAIVWCQKT